MTPSAPVRLIVGLGNPGSQYEQTRHNVGVWLIEELSRRYSTLSPLQSDSKAKGRTGQLSISGQPVRLLVPTTFMNLSGQSVSALANFYKLPVESILVAHDELDLAPGIVRLKTGGGHGGHNGLRDIISRLGNQKDFGRLRIGIGHPGNAKQVANYVLSNPSADERLCIERAIDEALRYIESIVRGDWQVVMNELHRFDGSTA